MSHFHICFDLTESSFAESHNFGEIDIRGQYPIDDVFCHEDKKSYLRYYHQEIRENDYILYHPYQDHDVCVMCSGVIDNLSELNTLWTGNASDNVCTVIYRGYALEGEAFIKRIYGDYAIIIIDYKQDRLLAFRDPLAKRTLYYRVESSQIHLSSLVSLIASEDEAEDEFWLLGNLAIPGTRSSIEADRTAVEVVKQVLPGYCLMFDSEGNHLQAFWKPEWVEAVRYRNRRQAYEAFYNLYKEAVECRVSKDTSAIMLSSGLDSMSIAAMVDSLDSVKKIDAYTYVPAYELGEEALKRQFRYIVNDEGSTVKEALTHMHKIVPHFWDGIEDDPVENIDEQVTLYEQPYKVVAASYWIENLYKRASRNGCKIVLSGQFGNTTISYGDWMNVCQQLLKEKKYPSYLSFIHRFGVESRVGRKRLLNMSIKNYVYSQESADYRRYEEHIDTELSRKHFIFDHIEKKAPEGAYKNHQEFMMKSLHHTILTQIGEMDFKLASKYGMISRDPTMDLRVIEFFLGMPDEYFYYKGTDRAFVRLALKDIMPDVIIKDQWHRGIQNADWPIRLAKSNVDWLQIVKEVHASEAVNKYYNEAYIIKIINRLESDESYHEDGDFLQQLISMFVFYKYVTNKYRQG